VLLQFKEIGNINATCLQQGGATYHKTRVNILHELFAVRLTSVFGNVA